MPREGCLDADEVLDKEVLGGSLGMSVHKMKGVTCSCLTDGCNHPAGTYESREQITFV